MGSVLRNRMGTAHGRRCRVVEPSNWIDVVLHALARKRLDQHYVASPASAWAENNLYRRTGPRVVSARRIPCVANHALCGDVSPANNEQRIVRAACRSMFLSFRSPLNGSFITCADSMSLMWMVTFASDQAYSRDSDRISRVDKTMHGSEPRCWLALAAEIDCTRVRIAVQRPKGIRTSTGVVRAASRPALRQFFAPSINRKYASRSTVPPAPIGAYTAVWRLGPPHRCWVYPQRCSTGSHGNPAPVPGAV